MARTKVHINSKRAKRLFAELAALDGLSARIAIKGRYPNGKNVAEVAATHEYGRGRVPPRPFLSQAARDAAKARDVYRRTLNRMFSNTWRATSVVAAMARSMAKLVRQSIETSPKWAIPLALRTVQDKRRRRLPRPEHPLIATQRLIRDSVYWQVARGDKVLREGLSK